MNFYAPAKVNLYLDILKLRKDGYHEIDTVFQTIGLCDTLELQSHRLIQNGKGRADIQLELNRRSSVFKDSQKKKISLGGKDNIVWRAADAFLAEKQLSGTCQIKLTKDIPIQAGLGGGSSDAAAMIRMAQSRFTRVKNKLSTNKLKSIAVKLGADVPFFLNGGCARATGIGEKIQVIKPAPKFWAVVIKPHINLSTKEVYGWYDSFQASLGAKKRKKSPNLGGLNLEDKLLTKKPKINRILRCIKQGLASKHWSPYMYNCFEDVVYKKVPFLANLKGALLRYGCQNALLSGSGSALFGLVGSEKEGDKIRNQFKDSKLKVWVVRSVS